MMATGYVHPVADGEITDLRTFALRCSRGMMALVTMRDAPNDTPIPRQLEPDLEHYEERLAEVQTRLDRLAMETEAEREARVEAEYQEALKSAEEYDAESALERERVITMRAKVEAWQGAPEDLKEFMLSQIDSSLGSPKAAPYRAVDYVTKRDPDEDWRNAVEAVGRAYANIEREKALTKSRNVWLDQLWASLPTEEQQP
jgi:hypothetical protein